MPLKKSSELKTGIFFFIIFIGNQFHIVLQKRNLLSFFSKENDFVFCNSVIGWHIEYNTKWIAVIIDTLLNENLIRPITDTDQHQLVIQSEWVKSMGLLPQT